MKDIRREQLAALAHEQWSGWMHYLFSKSAFNDDGSFTIPPASVDRWKRQMDTPYHDLPESEKDSDRVEADKVMALTAEWDCDEQKYLPYKIYNEEGEIISYHEDTGE